MAMTSEELRAIQEMCRAFVEDELIPLERLVDEKGLPEEEWERLTKVVVDLGLRGLRFPEHLGGAGGGVVATAVMMREFGRTAHSFLERLLLSVDTSLLSGSAAQQDAFLRPAIEGKTIMAFALSEPHSGSDAATVATTATRTDEGWVLDGRKVFATLAPIADVITVIARTGDREEGRNGLSAFIVTRGTPGLLLGPENDKVGYRGVPQSDVILDQCVVPHENIIGEPGDGWRITTTWTASERVMQAAWCLGSAERCLQLAADYAPRRETFGKPLSDRQAIQWMLADSALSCTAARALVTAAAEAADEGKDVAFDGACAKLFAGEMAGRVIDACQQIFGGQGYMRDYPFDMLSRDVRLSRIGGGTSEMMRMIISRSVLKGSWVAGNAPVWSTH